MDVNDLKGLFVEVSKRMDVALQHVKHELAGVRTGRASTALLDHVQVGHAGRVVLPPAPERERRLAVELEPNVRSPKTRAAWSGSGSSSRTLNAAALATAKPAAHFHALRPSRSGERSPFG